MPRLTKPSCTLLFALTAILALVPLAFAGELPAASKPSAAEKAAASRIRTQRARATLAFEPNRGQTAPEVLYQSRGLGYNLFLTPKDAILRLGRGHSPADLQKGADGRASAQRTVLDLRLLNANQSPQVSAEDPLITRSNYIRGSDPSKWVTGVPTYGKVAMDNVYPGIRLDYYGTQEQLEEDWVVSPGASPGRIAFEVRGAKSVSITPDGELSMAVPDGAVTFRRPVVYQVGEHGRVPVEGGFTLKGRNRVGFRVGRYDRMKPLVIDPVITVATYLGGSDIDEARDEALDSSLDLYVAGDTESTDFPIDNAEVQDACKLDTSGLCERSGFITKYNFAGNVLFSTYFGGSGSQYVLSIALDSAANAYITGQTTSTDLPTANAYASSCALDAGDCLNAFLAEISSDGSSLLYSTYFGGTAGLTSSASVAIDSTGNAYIAGDTTSPNLPVTKGVLQSKCGTDGNCNATSGSTNSDTFIAKFNTSNETSSTLIYSTYLGGSGVDSARAIVLDATNNAYITGSTTSLDLPSTAGVVQPACKLDANKACEGEPFVAKINPTATAIVYLTYVGGSGGSGLDTATDIDVDTSGNAYIVGQTSSSDFPVTTGAFQATCGTDGKCNPVSGVPTPNAFATKLNSTATALMYSTFLGGSQLTVAESASLDQWNCLYISGGTYSTDFPTVNSLPGGNANAGGEDAFAAALDTTGAGLLTSSYIGGSGNDIAYGLLRDNVDDLFIVGSTDSTNFPTTANANQPFPGGGGDAFMYQAGQVTIGFTALSPSSLNFGTINVGTASPAQTVTVTNSGNANMTITTMVLAGTNASDFTATSDTCPGATLAPGSSCVATLTFTPAAEGAASGTLTINSSSVNAAAVVTLTGTGQGPVVSLAPGSLTFSAQVEGLSSSAQTITLTNTGDAALNITSIAIASTAVTADARSGRRTSARATTSTTTTADFTETNTCGSQVAAGAPCAITVTFTPQATGTRTANVVITDDAAGSPQLASLTGTGTSALLTIVPTSETFTYQAIGTTSLAKTVTLSSNGQVTFSSVSITGANASDFAETNTCAPVLLLSTTCTATVTFSPTATGTRTASLTFTDDATGSPQTVALTGTGVISTVVLSTTSLTFPAQAIGTTSTPQNVTINNAGEKPLTFTSFAFTGPNGTAFAQTNNCAGLTEDSACTLQVTFSPTVSGAQTGTLTLTDNGTPSPTQTISLAGTGIGAAVTFNPPSLSFPSTVLKTSAPAQTVTMTNTGTTTLSITGISVTGTAAADFGETNTCGTSLAEGVSCQITVSFLPVTGGTLSAAVTVTGNFSGANSESVPLTGLGGDFSVTMTNSVTVNAGQEAIFNVQMNPIGGFNKTVNITCTGAPNLSTCEVSPSANTLFNGITPVLVSLDIFTTAPTLTVPPGRAWPRGPSGPWTWLLLLGMGALAMALRRRRATLLLGMAALGMMVWMGCGSSSAGPSTPGTPPGTYSISTTVTYGGLSHSASGTLIVH